MFMLGEASASQLGPAAVASVKLNVARQYMLLVDLLSVLNSGLPPEQRFLKGEQAGIEQALATAGELVSLSSDSGADLVSAVAHEIIAHLAYRQGDYERCRREASAARGVYLDHGFLVGVEGIERLLGLTYLRESETPTDNSSALRGLALHHFLMSHELSEALRQRFPEDAVGLTRAGFLARRAYVNEKIVELHLHNAQPELALSAVEAVKSRALSDILLLQQRAAVPTPHVAEHLEPDQIDWPQGAVALEYFIGSQRAWVFLIQGKNVQAFPLADADGKPIESRRLVSDVQQLLFDMEGSAQKMLRRIQSGRALDDAWQDKLHAFYHVLLPSPARAQIESAKLLVIVPHHILHYFPFAALVTEPDQKPRKSAEMPMPRFLIDQVQAINYAPSLSTWSVLRANSPPAKSVNAVAISEFAGARSLPGARQDLQNLRHAFGAMLANVVQDSDATEQELLTVLKQPGFTYIGTHGVNIADRPLASFLLCQPGDGDRDGRITAAELYDIKPAADVVVLSACYSGLGDRSPLPGDDLFGLQRAFLHTGVDTVVAGLWDVYDDTGVAIMRDFFAALRGGETVVQALADSQRTFLAARRAEGPTDFWIHPYFWAVYKSTGSDVARVAPPQETNSKK
jgi:CHAT domain-containing protein